MTERRSLRILIFGLSWIVFGSSEATAATINIGSISFDVLIPGAPGAPGVNDFTISNLTGDPASGGFALPPDFPVFANLALQDASLTIQSDSGSQAFMLGDLGSGYSNPGSLVFSATTEIFSALFTATLSSSNFLLSDGTTFSASASQISASLEPSSGTSLTPSVDLVLLQVSNVPEPATGLLYASALAVLLIGRRRLT